MNEKEISEQFGKLMYEKLEKRHDRYAPLGWKTLDLVRVFMMLKEELRVLENTQLYLSTVNGDEDTARQEKAKRVQEMKDNAIDIANYAMFVYDIIDKTK